MFVEVMCAMKEQIALAILKKEQPLALLVNKHASYDRNQKLYSYCTHNDPSVKEPYAELQCGEMRYYFDCGTEDEVDGSGYVYSRGIC